MADYPFEQFEQLLNTTPALALPYTFVSVQGLDAAKLLQGQISCDVENLDPVVPSFGTANTPKGRMYCLFRILPWEDGFLLGMHSSLAKSFMTRLQKYAAFFKCELTIETSIQALAIQEGNAQAKAGICVFHPFSGRGVQEIWTSEPLTEQSDSSELIDEWCVLNCLEGIPELYPETLEQFILQQLNLQDLGAVSFKKGCYTGQEIIARMKYLGKLKKKMFVISSQTLKQAVKPGSDVLSLEGKKIGELVRLHFSRITNAYVGLAVLDIAYTEQYDSAKFDSPEDHRLHIVRQ